MFWFLHHEAITNLHAVYVRVRALPYFRRLAQAIACSVKLLLSRNADALRLATASWIFYAIAVLNVVHVLVPVSLGYRRLPHCVCIGPCITLLLRLCMHPSMCPLAHTGLNVHVTVCVSLGHTMLHVRVCASPSHCCHDSMAIVWTLLVQASEMRDGRTWCLTAPGNPTTV